MNADRRAQNQRPDLIGGDWRRSQLELRQDEGSLSIELFAPYTRNRGFHAVAFCRTGGEQDYRYPNGSYDTRSLISPSAVTDSPR